MPYSVRVEHLDENGAKAGDTLRRSFATQEAAFAFTRTAIRLARPLRERMVFSLHDEAGLLLMSYATAVEDAPGAAANGNVRAH